MRRLADECDWTRRDIWSPRTQGITRQITPYSVQNQFASKSPMEQVKVLKIAGKLTGRQQNGARVMEANC